MHYALGTNKLSSAIGTTASAIRYVVKGFIFWKLSLPAALLAIIGARLGAGLQLLIDEKYSKIILLPVLIVVAVMLLKDKDFTAAGTISEKKQTAIVWCTSLAAGVYDGFSVQEQVLFC